MAMNQGRERTIGRTLVVVLGLVLAVTGHRPAMADIAGCPVLPADNVWNAPVDTLPVHPRSSAYVNSIGASVGMHPDFGAAMWNGGPIGIPFITVPGSQPRVPVSFDYASESDPGPYPIPPGAPIEGGPGSSGDRHVLVVDRDNCVLYELFAAYPQPGGGWHAGSGAVFDLRSNALRPSGWTSADAAGLAILPGLVRYDEVAAGEIRHALRFTARVTQRAFVWPARHFASSNTSPNVPPMGQRFRLRASFDVTPFPPAVQVILRALKKYGMMLSDNGSNWYLSGVPDPRWNDDQLVSSLRLVKGSDFEAVDVSPLLLDPNSGRSRIPGAGGLAAFGDFAGDYDGDNRAEVGVYRGATGEWLLRRSGTGALTVVAWGAPVLDDKPAPGDYDGDDRTDVAVYRRSTGVWFIRRSTDLGLTQVAWGSPFLDDVAAPADYDGDQRTDIAVYRRSTGVWFIRRSTDLGLTQVAWGSPFLDDVPVPGDYDGDGKADIAVYRRSTGVWFIRRSSDLGLTQVAWGSPFLDDVPVPAHYSQASRADIAVYRRSTGVWLIRRSTDLGLTQVAWGAPVLDDVPVPADYDGDGRADIAIYRRSNGEWYVRRTTDTGLWFQPWGSPFLKDVPARP
jgi:hypothetical protein